MTLREILEGGRVLPLEVLKRSYSDRTEAIVYTITSVTDNNAYGYADLYGDPKYPVAFKLDENYFIDAVKEAQKIRTELETLDLRRADLMYRLQNMA